MKTKIDQSITVNESDYLAAAKKCAEDNGGYFSPQDLRLYGYEPRGQSLNGTTGSLVNKGVISEPTEGWHFIEEDADMLDPSFAEAKAANPSYDGLSWDSNPPIELGMSVEEIEQRLRVPEDVPVE